MPVQRLHYEDYRDIQPGDKGTVPNHPDQKWVYSKELQKKKRWKISPSTGETITLRKFQELARGEKYTEFVKHRQEKGQEPRKNKPRKGVVQKPEKPKKKPPKKQPEKQAPKKPPSKQAPKVTPQAPSAPAKKPVSLGQMRTKMNERALFLKQRYAMKLSEQLGYRVKWAEMEDAEKTEFWNKYHKLVYRRYRPGQDEFREEFQDYFDMDYDEVGDLPYGETP